MSRYPIVVDGSVQVVKADKLRLTYARLLYEDGDDVKTIQQKLGCSDIKKILGFIGPLEVRRDEKEDGSITALIEMIKEWLIARNKKNRK